MTNEDIMTNMLNVDGKWIWYIIIWYNMMNRQNHEIFIKKLFEIALKA